MSGQAFCGPDVGGFAGDATPKLFARWMGLGAMLPFARGHSEQGTIDQEPWSFGPEVILLLLLYWAYSGFFKGTDCYYIYYSGHYSPSFLNELLLEGFKWFSFLEVFSLIAG